MVPVEAPHEIDLTDPPLPVVSRGWAAAPVIVVGIVDEHEMFALGIRTCLAESPLVRVAPVVDEDVDVVIVSPRMAEECRFAAPLVICGDPPKRLAPGNVVMAVLGRASLTGDHLLASIHAAAAGLRVVHEEHTASPRLAGRGLEVLALLASGADTKEIEGKVLSARDTAAAINGSVKGIGQSLAGILATLRSTQTAAGEINTSTRGINTAVVDLLPVTKEIDAGIARANQGVVEALVHVEVIRTDIGNILVGVPDLQKHSRSIDCDSAFSTLFGLLGPGEACTS